jgi:hypothetical protein
MAAGTEITAVSVFITSRIECELYTLRHTVVVSVGELCLHVESVEAAHRLSKAFADAAHSLAEQETLAQQGIRQEPTF